MKKNFITIGIINLGGKKMYLQNKEVTINFDIPQFNDLFKLIDADSGRERENCPHSLQAADDGDNISESAPA